MPPHDESKSKDTVPYGMPPQNIEAEESIISAILIDNDALLDVIETLGPEDFYRTAHQKIYAAITDLFDKAEPVDLVTLANKLKEKGVFLAHSITIAVCLVLFSFILKDISRNKVYKNNKTFYAAAIADSPSSPPSYKGLGAEFFDEGKFSSAVDNFNKAINLDSCYTEALILNAKASIKLKRYANSRD